MLTITKLWWQMPQYDDQCVVLKSVRLCRHTYFPILHCLYVSLYTVVVVFDGDILSTYRVKKVELWFILRTTRKQIPFTQDRVELLPHTPSGAAEMFSSDYRRDIFGHSVHLYGFVLVWFSVYLWGVNFDTHPVITVSIVGLDNVVENVHILFLLPPFPQ